MDDDIVWPFTFKCPGGTECTGEFYCSFMTGAAFTGKKIAESRKREGDRGAVAKMRTAEKAV